MNINSMIQTFIEQYIFFRLDDRKQETLENKRPMPALSDYERVVRQLDLDVFFLCFVLRQEDGMISPDESRIIMKQITPYSNTLEEVDRNRLLKYAKRNLTLDDVLIYIKERNFTGDEMRKVFSLLNEVNHITKRHGSIIGSLMDSIFKYHGRF